MMMPVLFISHGAPSLPAQSGPSGEAWRGLAAELKRPSAILVVSAHWETPVPTVSRAERPETIHDFSGFSEQLYRMRYPAPGAPELADRVANCLRQARIEVAIDPQRGLDHGAWVPLAVMYPDADIPVASLSVLPERDSAFHVELGRALQPLREEGVLILCSGAITHNLGAIFRHPQGAPVPGWVTQFCDWIAQKIAAGELDRLIDYRREAPGALDNHPRDEHLLPLFVALGAALHIEDSRHLNRVVTYGMLAMDAWLFDVTQA